jgi:uncharacterized membrane protein YgcG
LHGKRSKTLPPPVTSTNVGDTNHESTIHESPSMNNQQHDMAYNTSNETIKFPEYGRSVEQLLEHAAKIENVQLRQKTVDTIFKIILTLNPGNNNRNYDDFRERVWNHMFKMTDYKLNVQPPDGVLIRKDQEKSKPEPVAYPKSDSRFRHYGNNVKTLIEKAIAMEDGPKKEGLVEVIASYMKLAYKTWAREHYVSDDIVKDDLIYLSDGKLELHENYNSLDLLAAGISGRRDLQGTQGQRKGRGGNRGGGMGSSRSGGTSGGNRGNRGSGGNSGGGMRYDKRKRR